MPNGDRVSGSSGVATIGVMGSSGIFGRDGEVESGVDLIPISIEQSYSVRAGSGESLCARQGSRRKNMNTAV